MILNDLKIIFFHIGKTGGSTIEKVLGYFTENNDLINNHVSSPLYGKTNNIEDYNIRKKFMMGFLNHANKHANVWGTYLQHADIEIFKTIHDDNNYKDYYKFAFVRNPLDRTLSAYYYNGYDKHTSFKNFIKKDLINIYLVNVTKQNHLYNNHFAPQYKFTHFNGIQYVDFIGKFENFKNDFEFVLNKLNIKYNKEFPIMAKTKKNIIYKNYIDAYDDETIDIVKKIYEFDFKLFNYESF